MAENEADEQAPVGAAKPQKTPTPNTTLADRAKARKGRKQVSEAEAEDKAVRSAESKRRQKG